MNRTQGVNREGGQNLPIYFSRHDEVAPNTRLGGRRGYARAKDVFFFLGLAIRQEGEQGYHRGAVRCGAVGDKG